MAVRVTRVGVDRIWHILKKWIFLELFFLSRWQVALKTFFSFSFSQCPIFIFWLLFCLQRSTSKFSSLAVQPDLGLHSCFVGINHTWKEIISRLITSLIGLNWSDYLLKRSSVDRANYFQVCLVGLSSTRHITPLSINFFTTIREQKSSHNRKSSSLLLVTSFNFGKKDSNERNYILHRRPKILNEPQKDPIIQRWPKYRRRNLTLRPIFFLVNLFSITWSFYIFIQIISPLQYF